MKTILVVDDEENIRQLFKEEFEDAGYNVALAKDGEEALKRIDENDIDLVTLDMRMPGIDGIETIRKIKEIRHDLPVIVCTVYGDYRHNFAVWAAEAYFIKSGDLTPLKEKISEILS